MARNGEVGTEVASEETTAVVSYTPFGFEPLVGSYPMALETNGRVVLPAALREPYEKHAYLVPAADGCVMVFTPFVFRLFTEQVDKSQDPEFDDPRMVKRIAAMARKVTVDKQSRLVIPPDLRASVGLGDRIRVNGSVECIEIWHDNEWVAEEEPFLGQTKLVYTTYRGM